MATTKTPDEIKADVFKSLEGTQYAVTTLEPLSGGNANFTYRADLSKALDDGTTEVLVKHGEGFMAAYPSNKLSITRCGVEFECLRALESTHVNVVELDGSSFVVRTPKCYFYDTSTNTQVQEYLPRAINLKSYALDHFRSPTPESLKPHCHVLGRTLALWITEFQNRRYGAASNLYEKLGSNLEMQKLKHMINFDSLLKRVDQFPNILDGARDIFQQVKEMAVAELNGNSENTFIHGDFCPGNILLPNVPIQAGVEMPLFIVDWENAQLGLPSLDGGEMIGELYALYLCKKIDAGLWVIQGYTEGLGQRTESSAWRLAIQAGVHLLAFGTITPGMGTTAQIDDLARMGRDIIVNAWQRNREWFDRGDLACLFTNATL